MTTETPPPPPCSVCAGKWLHGLTHRHAVTCPRYDGDTATIHADHRRRLGVRPATETELEIIGEHGYEAPPKGGDYRIRFRHAGGLHTRTVLISSRLKGWTEAIRETEEEGDDHE